MVNRNIERVEGQIWIEKETPHNLKYFTNSKTYTLSPTAVYEYEDKTTSSALPGEVILPAGSVVKFQGKDNLKKAIFPDDLEGVLGVTTSDLRKGEGLNKLKVTVAQDGYVLVNHPEKVFATEEDYTLNIGNKYTSSSIIGKPVYWFIGRIIKKGDNQYSYISTENKAGNLTLATPSGFINDENVISDNSLNIGYDNLPQIGTVASIQTSEGNPNKITSMVIHLNFSKFDSSLEWNWPRIHDNSEGKEFDCGKAACGYDADSHKMIPANINIRHGLFPSKASRDQKKYASRCFLDVTANPLLEDSTIDFNTEYIVDTDVHNEYDSEKDPRTIVRLSSPYPMFYRISGRVNYKFDKNHDPLK